MDTITTLLERLHLPQNCFEGKTVVITGGARGIGEAVATGLAHLGATVVIFDIRDEGAEVATRIQGNIRSAEFIQVDLADKTAVDEAAREVIHRHGSVDVLINNASKFKADRFLETSTDHWDDLHYTTARASTQLIKYFLPTMIAQEAGVICNTVAAEGLTHVAHFSSAMAGQRSMILSLAGEYGPETGIHTFGFAPGVVDTPLVHEGLPDLLRLQGISAEDYINGLRNPGYDGLMPVADCAASYIYCIANAPIYHGQLADAFHPLIAHGLISVPENVTNDTSPSGHLARELFEVNAFVNGVSSTNLNLERRIVERTRELQDANSQLAQQKQFIESISTKLSRYLPQQVYQSIFSGDLEAAIETQRKPLTILFADIKEFTVKTEKLEPEVLSSILNIYFSAMTEIAKEYGATVDKFIGDAILIFFGDPETEGQEADAHKAVAMAIAMQRRMRALQAEFRKFGLGTGLQIRIGINSGYCTVGNFGSYDRMDYTIIGTPVNIAARLQTICPTEGILISWATRELVKGAFDIVSFQRVALKGIAEEVDTYSVNFSLTDEKADSDQVSERLTALKTRIAELGDLDQSDPDKSALLNELMSVLEAEVGKPS